MPSLNSLHIEKDNWVCSWLSTSQPTSGDAFPFPLEIPKTLHNQTIKQALRISIGGQKLRFVFSNRYGKQPLILGDSYFSLNKLSHSPIRITFNGNIHTVIPIGEIIYSDEITLNIPSLSLIYLSVYLPELISIDTFHWDSRHFSTLEYGNRAKNIAKNNEKITSRLLLERIEVLPRSTGKTIVAIGDSMIDGNGVEMDTYHRWTDYLAERLVPKNIAVVNAGQSGSRLLKDGIGISTLSRFERDVLNQVGVKGCIVQVGLNDIGLAGTAIDPSSEIPTADKLIDGYRQLLNLAHKNQVSVVGVTITPLRSVDEYGLEHFYQPEKEVIRQQVNQWMREGGEFDALIDSDSLIRDELHIHQLSLEYDIGDHLHLNNKGHQLIAYSIELDRLFSQD